MADDPKTDTLILMGRLWRAHGLDGEVKVIPETDDPVRFEMVAVLYVGRTPSTARPYRIESVRHQVNKKGPIAIVKLDGVNSREDAEGLRSSSVFADPDELPALNEGEIYLHDLVGLEAVLEEDGSVIGVIDDVLDLPGQDLLVIARAGRQPAMVPAVPEFVVDIDLDAERVVIRPIEGLLEE